MNTYGWFDSHPDTYAPAFDSALALIGGTWYGAPTVQSGQSTMDANWSTGDMSVAARVARGMTYLRQAYPDALLFIDIDTVDIAGHDTCVLGQIWGGYGNAPELDTHTAGWRHAHGFTLGEHDEVGPLAALHALTAEWRGALHGWLGDRA